MIKYFSITDGKIIQTENTSASIRHYINPDENEKRLLVETYKIDEHTLNSSLDADELSRFEIEPQHTAVIFKTPKNYTAHYPLLFKVDSAGLFLFKDKLILVTNEELQFFNGKPFLKVNSLNDAALKVIFRSIYHFMEHLKVINMLSDEIEAKISKSMENKYLLNQFKLGKSLVYFQNGINSNTVLLEKMKLNAQKLNLNVEETELLDDIIIENNQCYRQAEIYSNILASLMDAKASLISNNLNMLMKTLNIITIAIMVPTFVVSAFSMNVKIPLQDRPDAFLIVMGLALISVIAFLMFWKWKKW
ncbi:MAG: magnesium transporter CorA family protein [Bacteroidota bacterium]